MSNETATETTGIEIPNWLSGLFKRATLVGTLEELLNYLNMVTRNDNMMIGKRALKEI